MTKAAQNLLLITVGASVLWITLATDEYLNYVKPGFRVMLIGAGAAMCLLGAAGVRREWRADTGTHDQCGGQGHGHGPGVAWLLCVPALALFLVAPPALGSFTASRASRASAPAPPEEGYGLLKATGGPIEMTMGEFVGRSFETQTGHPSGLDAVQVKLTGFVGPRGKGGGWTLTRLRIGCCAGDAIPYRAIVHGIKQPPTDSWAQVVGTWMPTTGALSEGVHELRGQSVQLIKKPRNSYE